MLRLDHPVPLNDWHRGRATITGLNRISEFNDGAGLPATLFEVTRSNAIQRHIDIFLQAAAAILQGRDLYSIPNLEVFYPLPFYFLFIPLVALLMLWRGRRSADVVYMKVILLPPLFTPARFDPDLPLASLPRFLVVAFPGFIALGAKRLREPLPRMIAVLSLLLQTFMLLIFTQWIFAG
jgi:hypothetical protein